jgi:hypothetical protein
MNALLEYLVWNILAGAGIKSISRSDRRKSVQPSGIERATLNL